jgi:predicted DNA-binding antitoxin AbrB/MazE fold protein
MTQVEAIFENGVLRPLGPLPLRDRQQVRIFVEPRVQSTPEAWRKVFERREEARREIGTLPDSTPLIREDRMRGV